MTVKKVVSGLIGFLLAAAVSWGWASTPAAAQGKETVVFAAASLKDALNDINAHWQKDTGKKASISYASSGILAKQIVQGAPADIFISADIANMDLVQKRGLVKAGTRSNLLGNKLVLVAEKDSKIAPIQIAHGFDLAKLLGSGRLAMGDVMSVPAGKYGKAALQSLGVWPSVESKVAQAENVRAALLLVSRGEAPLGVVYATDAAADPNVKVIGIFPESSHPPIIYPAALTATSRSPDAAAFLAYLKSSKAKPLFEKQGFTVLAK
jgi:molybdate transport system substrate-binding protein